jgi:hypothetical protein
MKSSWRDHARPIIAQVLRETQGMGEKAIRKALLEAYPFHQRKYHPYKIWLDEIALQRGTKKRKNIFGRRKKAKPADPNQLSMEL